MEFTGLILPLTKNICRTCLMETEPSSFMSIQDVIEHDDMNKVKLIDILVYLNFLENNDEENWPQGICSKCVSACLASYNFKLECLKATSTLSRILMIQSPTNFQRTDIDAIDINVVYQDHEYDVPLFSNHHSLDFESSLTDNKITPLPPVTEITATEQPLRLEGEKKYSCNVCYKSFTRISGLRYHMNKHTDVKRFLCTKCGKGFYTASNLKQHAISHKETAQFKCGFCNKTYKSRQSLKEHFRKAHSSNRKSLVCVTCGNRFTMRSTLMAHIKTHNGQKFPCPSCPKVYSRATYLKAHSVVHTGQERPRPFSCTHDNCDRRFTTKYSLSVHIAHTHTVERPHQCYICPKRFATPSGLKIHLDSHINSEICCNICGKKLSNRRVLQKHLKTHDIDTNDMILENVVDSVYFDHY